MSVTSFLTFFAVKKQKHDMTHVEVWAGDGPKTIGARWHRGKVQVFDSYRFEAKSYHSPTYHLKSIDTWLKGICRRLAQHRATTDHYCVSPNKGIRVRAPSWTRFSFNQV